MNVSEASAIRSTEYGANVPKAAEIIEQDTQGWRTARIPRQLLLAARPQLMLSLDFENHSQ